MIKLIQRIIILLHILILFSCVTIPDRKTEQKQSSIHSHILILKDGNEYKGRLKGIDTDTITFIINGEEKTWARAEINRIQFHRKRLYEDVENISQINDEEIQFVWNASNKWKPSQDLQVVILLDKTIVEFGANNKIIIRIKRAMKILNESGKEHSTQYFYYFKDNSNAKLLYGITILADGSITSVEESAINDEPINNKVPHYDILHRIKFGLKDIDIGSVFVWEAEISGEWDMLKQPYLFNRQLIGYNPVEKRVVKIISPATKKIDYSIYQGLIPFDKPNIKKEKKKNMIIYSVEQNNVPVYIDDEDNSPSDSLIYPKFYAAPDVSWKELTSIYYKKYFEKPILENIKNLALKIIKKEDNTQKKLSLLYNHVNRAINKVEVSMHNFHFIPIDEDKLPNLASLNVLDKSYLFVRMSKALGIPVKMFLYRSNYKNSIVNEFPSLKHFDSVICKAVVENKPIFYSFENQNYGAGQTGYSISQAWALEVTKEANNIEILQKIPYDYNQYEYDYQCTLDEDNTLNIKKTTTIFGPSQVVWRVKRFLTNEELDKFMKSRVSNLGNNASLESYRFINNLDDFEKPIIIEENIRISNYSFSSGENIKLLKIPGIKFNAGTVSKIDRVLPYDIGATSKSIYRLNLSFPDKYKVEYLPKALNLGYEGFSFSSDYSTKDNMIIVDINTCYTKDLIPVSQYKELKSWIEQRAKLTDQWILLEAKD